jgi:cytochrome P450
VKTLPATLATDVPSVDVDLTDWGFNQDPHPVMEEWRRLGPVVYNARHSCYMVTSYRNCARVLGNLEQFSMQPYIEQFKRVFGGITMEVIDTPRHHDVRGIWARDFQRDDLQHQQRRMVEEVVVSLVDPFVERVRSGEAVDAVPGLSRSIPTLVIAHLLGVGADMIQQFSDWSDAMGAGNQGLLDSSARGRKLMQDGKDATKALNSYVAEEVIRRRGRPPQDDLISRMVFSPFARADMDEQEIVASISQLVFAGNETTAKLMASALVAFARWPGQWEMLRADRSLLPQALEEVHRWATPTQSVHRFACSDKSEIEGVRIPSPVEVMPLLGAANRDPARWERPHEFDIRRPPRQHLGFGFGMHVCLGLNLARLEVQVLLEQLLDKLPAYRLGAPVDYGRVFPLRGPLSVSVVVG